MDSVGVCEAKARLPQLLDRVARGEEIRIIRDGRPVARLVPERVEDAPDVRAVIAEVKEFRKGRGLNGVSIRELIEGEGRR